MTKNNVVVKIVKVGPAYCALDFNGKDWKKDILAVQRKKAYLKGFALERTLNKNGKFYWKMVPMDMFSLTDAPASTSNNSKTISTVSATSINNIDLLNKKIDDVLGFSTAGVSIPKNDPDIIAFIHDSYKLKPEGLVMSELKWKYLIRTALRGKNILITGMQGSGKTLAMKALVKALNRPTFVFNMGATQDPKSYLIGNTHYKKETGTIFSPSEFVTAIQTENAVIQLDELSRSHPDAWNILMPVLDYLQRYLRIDDAPDSPIVRVAKGVTFVSTANIGSEFTATRVMDRALLDRFTIIEVDILNNDEEYKLLNFMFPTLKEWQKQAISEISNKTRMELKSTSPKLTTCISTRQSVEVASLLFDGFKLEEAAEIAIYPFFSPDGGLDSERTYVKMMLQKYINDGSGELLFGQDEISNAPTSNNQ